MYGRAVLGNAIDKGGSWVYYIVLSLRTKFILLRLLCFRFTCKDNNDHQHRNEELELAFINGA